MTAPLIMPAAQAEAPGVRPLEPSDLEAVARLFQKRFRNGARNAPASLASYLGDIFLNHPWRDSEIASRVHVSADGMVDGFIGVFPSQMKLDGTSIRASFAGSLMVDEPDKNPLAGARLLRAFFAGPQDISISETCNPISQRMWTRLGGHLVPLASMEWLRLLHPARAGVSLAAERMASARFLWPLAVAADVALRRAAGDPFRLEAPSPARPIRDCEADEEHFILAALRLSSEFQLRPDWNAEILRWLLSHARLKERHGTIQRRLVYGPGPSPIGGYISYCKPSGIAWVLQMFAEPGRAEPVLDSVLAHTRNAGAVAVRGRSHALFMDGLFSRGCAFLHRSATMVHSRNATLLKAALSPSALMTGLAGETWTRLIGGEFR